MWFTEKLSLHPKTAVQSFCPPVNQSSDSDALTTLAVVGVLHLALAGESVLDPRVIHYLDNVSTVFANTDAVVAHLASMVHNNNPQTVEIIRYIKFC